MKGGGGGARRVGSVVGNVTKTEVGDVECFGLGLGIGEVVANDAVWAGEAEVVGVEGAPRDGWVDGVEDMVERVLLGWVQHWLLL